MIFASMSRYNQVTIALGIHLLPFRTEKLSLVTPMVLLTRESRQSPFYRERHFRNFFLECLSSFLYWLLALSSPPPLLQPISDESDKTDRSDRSDRSEKSDRWATADQCYEEGQSIPQLYLGLSRDQGRWGSLVSLFLLIAYLLRLWR